MKKKPIEMIKNKNAPLIKMEDELSTLVQFQENIMAQIIDRQDEAYANFLINQIIAFMDENNVSTCFVLNKEELLDCLKEHNKLHYEILNLQSQLDQANERLKGAGVAKFELGQEVFVFDWDEQIRSGRIYEVQTNAVLHDRQPHITYLVDFTGNYSDDDQENDYYEEKDIYATIEEAEKKLQELRGGK